MEFTQIFCWCLVDIFLNKLSTSNSPPHSILHQGTSKIERKSLEIANFSWKKRTISTYIASVIITFSYVVSFIAFPVSNKIWICVEMRNLC